MRVRGHTHVGHRAQRQRAHRRRSGDLFIMGTTIEQERQERMPKLKGEMDALKVEQRKVIER